MMVMGHDYNFSNSPVNDFSILTCNNQGYKFLGMTMADRIKRRMEQIGITQDQLARGAGVTQPAIWKLLTGKTKRSTRLAEIAATLQLTVDQLIGKEPMPGDTPEPSNIAPGPLVRGKVPLISWVQAGSYKEAIDLYQPGDAEEWIETTAPIGASTFALRVQGDSMEPLFPAGMLIVVEPNLDPLPGDYVIAKNGDEATFKQLIKDGGDWFLKPLNKSYPLKPLESTCCIIGVVREAVRRFR